jgi:heterodisulfide reductase subunit A
MDDSKKLKNEDTSNPRIGVFLCDCGTNIAGVVNVPEVMKYSKTLDNVVFVDEGKWICAVDYLTKLKEYIDEHDLNRVVVACCTPRTHEPTFKATIKEAGLNPLLLEFVSIREQSSWVHMNNPEAATQKAKELVRMGVEKAAFLEPGEELRIPVGNECLVIGGGLAGMTSAIALADLGFSVVLVEKDDELGGMLNKLYKGAPSDESAGEIIRQKIELIKKNENITVHTGTEVTAIDGYVGNFNITLEKNESEEVIPSEIQRSNIKVSTIIVATGMTEMEPIGQFGYGKYTNVITAVQFEDTLKNHPEQLDKFENIAFINCVNSRNSERGCCNVGCLTVIKNVKAIDEINSKINTYIFFRDFNITGSEVQYHYDAMEKYSAAFRYPDNEPPTIKLNTINNKLEVQAFDILSGSKVMVNADLVVLTTAYKGADSNQSLKGLLKVSTNQDGFFQEAHVKLRPLDFANEGIYLCGTARSPKSIKDTLEESLGAAMRAAIPMKRSYIETEGIVAKINPELCIECNICSDTCAFGAVNINIANQPPEVIQAICKGCGTCAASCPEEAISVVHYSDDQIMAQIEAATDSETSNKIVAFACHWCALGAVDNAGMSRFEYPANIRIIRVMCSGRVDPKFILHAFQKGAAGVLVAGCEIPTCHYISGNYYTNSKIMVTKKLLELAGIKPDRLRLEWLSAAQGPKFAKVVHELTAQVESLGTIENDQYTESDLFAAELCARSERVRILGTKITDFMEFGNKYNEQFTKHEIERLVDEIATDEYINQRILLAIKDKKRSITDLATELNTIPSRIQKNTQALIKNNIVKMDHGEGIISISDTDYPEAAHGTNIESSEHLQKNTIEHISTINEFDYLINGTSISALKKALELADNDNKKVCVISPNSSFTSGPIALINGFKDYPEYNEEHTSLIKSIEDYQNITILRNTLIHQYLDRDSNHLVLKRGTTFVNEEKCDNCGKCLEVCPVKIVDYESFGLQNRPVIDIPHPKGSGLKASISKGIPYCQVSCPIQMDVRGYIGKIADGDTNGSAEIMRRTNPLPDICGKVCDHACESTCARGFKDEPLEIRKLKRYAIEDQYNSLDETQKTIITRSSNIKNRDMNNKVAIIGSGPAGLAAAHDLAQLGYPVVIFEALSDPGGMLKVGIPDYRLPQEALSREINAIIDLGVELRLNNSIGQDLTISDLRNQGYKAILLASGAHSNYKLGIDGEDSECRSGHCKKCSALGCPRCPYHLSAHQGRNAGSPRRIGTL